MSEYTDVRGNKIARETTPLGGIANSAADDVDVQLDSDLWF